MTTEVLRNMIYAASPTLHNLGVVVLDEVHYLQDRSRGPVWEEVIVHLEPRRTARVSVRHRLERRRRRGMDHHRARAHRLSSKSRPGRSHCATCYLVGERGRDGVTLLPTFVDGADPVAEPAVVDRTPTHSNSDARDRRPAGRGVVVAADCARQRATKSSNCSTARRCCRPSSSCSAVPVAIKRSSTPRTRRASR